MVVFSKVTLALVAFNFLSILAVYNRTWSKTMTPTKNLHHSNFYNGRITSQIGLKPIHVVVEARNNTVPFVAERLRQ